MVFRMRFETLGGHVHCALFVAKNSEATFAKCGDFVVSRGEQFVDLISAAPKFQLVGDIAKASTDA